jgi:hypothetical protein
LQAVACVTARDVHDEAQVRHHQLAGRTEVVFLAETARQRLLLVLAQHRNAVHCRDIGIEAADDTRHRHVGGHQGLGHG